MLDTTKLYGPVDSRVLTDDDQRIYDLLVGECYRSPRAVKMVLDLLESYGEREVFMDCTKDSFEALLSGMRDLVLISYWDQVDDYWEDARYDFPP